MVEATAHDGKSIAGLTKIAAYRELKERLAALYLSERDGLANAANLSAILYQGLQHVNWVGFYFARGDELVLGPFQGKVACVRIAQGRGVCGAAAARRQTLVVADVHAFPGHIACDAASRAEIVVPVLQRDRLVGVLDLDSPQLGRFDQDDVAGLEAIVDVFVQKSDLTRLGD